MEHVLDGGDVRIESACGCRLGWSGIGRWTAEGGSDELVLSLECINADLV